MVQNLPHRIMRLILWLSAKIEGPVDSFLIVFACLFVRKRERNRQERREEERKRSSLVFHLEQREKKKYSDNGYRKEKGTNEYHLSCP